MESFYEDNSTINAIYELHQRRKGSKAALSTQDIHKQRKSSEEELKAKIFSSYMEGCFQISRFLHKSGSIKNHKGLFTNASKIYENRFSIFKDFPLDIFLPYNAFNILYDYKNVSLDNIKNEINRKFSQTKELISQSVKLNNGKKSNFHTEILMSIVKSSIAISKFKEGDKIKVTFVNNNPTFEIE